MEKVLSLGYDLGDGETIIDARTFEIQDNDGNGAPAFADTEIPALQMPDSQRDGEALPTGFGYDQNKRVFFVNSILGVPNDISNIHAYFKRRPTDLLGDLSNERYIELVNLFKSGNLPSVDDCPEITSSKFEEFKNSVQTFTNAIFSDASFQERLNFYAKDCQRIKFCVGHPTKWNRLDALIYFAILNETVLGNNGRYLRKPTELVLAEESRAAYLYMRDINRIVAGRVRIIPEGTCTLLIDVGSSTVDITAVTRDARNYQYNSGNNYLGVRSIDFMIKDWFLRKIEEKRGAAEFVADIIRNNPSQETAMILACRKAKETAYSNDLGASQISFQVLQPLTQNDINTLAWQKPVASALSEFMKIPPDEVQKLGDSSWTELFRKFLKEQKTAIQNAGLKIGRIIMTGSAVRMSFVPEIIREVFDNVPVNEKLLDPSPSRSISKGLALVGPTDEKSKQFQKDIEKLMATDIPAIIERNLPALADSIAPIIEKIIVDAVLRQVERWRKGNIKTLNDMSAEIELALSENNLKPKLDSNEKYKAALGNWTVETLGKDIANKLLAICTQYNVTAFNLDSLNVAKNITVNPQTGNIEIAPFGGVIDVAGGIAGIVGGTIAFVIFPAIAYAVLLIVGSISTTIAGALFTVLTFSTGGFALIALICAVTVGYITKKNIGDFKDAFNQKVATYNVPDRARKKLKDADIKEKLAEQNLKSKIKDSLLNDKAKVANAVSAAISEQVKQRTDEIRFFIES